MPEQQTITIILPIPDLNFVLNALGKLPFEQVAELLIGPNGIRTQANQQMQSLQAQPMPPPMPKPNGELRDAA
jgi:hypothetical protein